MKTLLTFFLLTLTQALFAETYQVFTVGKAIQYTEPMGTIEIEKEKASLVDWGLERHRIDGLSVARQGAEIRILMRGRQGRPGCEVILTKLKGNKYKYDFCFVDVTRKDFATKDI